ncbi:MAG: hypothetical protein U0694_10440 [Anaerolineae bacterium]
MATWIKVDERDDSATFINLDGALRFDYRKYASGGGRVRIYFNGSDIEVSSERDPNAYASIMAYLTQQTGFDPYAEEGQPEGEDESSEA